MESSSSSSKRKRNSDSFDEVTSCKRPKNDVFLNYSYEDTGKSFVSHLKGGLTRNGFTISDHSMLHIGADKTSELVKAIEDSEIYLVVFSSTYASSITCLDELVNIMDCLPKFKKRNVFPIFFNVDPSHVRSQQEGSFMEAFLEHETKINHERVQKWRQALKDAGQVSGLTFTNGVDEAEFILRVVEELEKMQSPQDLHITDHHVGIGSRREELISKLRLDSKDQVLVVGVFGISGIGKTTIVKATYNRISAKFDVSCFLEDICDQCERRNWKAKLQKKLISYLTQNGRHLIMHNHNDGVAKIRRLIRGRKILLVLDDVDKFQQLEELGINPAWFCNGSRIIVTTRDKHSLGYIPYTSYHTMLLNGRESLNLFTRLMFSRDDLVNTEFIQEVVSHARGLPLVLTVWGRHFKQYERKQWPSILETLKRIPHGDVQKKLQLSYDSLPDRSKKLFLDIVCFFNGWEKDFVVKVLQEEDSGFFPDLEIQHLVDKGLVRITKFRLSMHHAIWEMAREVIRQEVVRREIEDKPGQHTRLKDFEDVVHVLRDCSGTESVEGIYLDYDNMEEPVTVQVEAFKKMTNLRFIQLVDYGSYLQLNSTSSSSSNDDMSSLSFKKLKYLEWQYFPLKSIDNIDMGNVVVIKLWHSKLEILWEGFKSLKKLRILDVSYSRSLTKTGNFTGLQKLEELYLNYCDNLEELHSSIGFLEKLEGLALNNCISNTLYEVGSLPDSLSHLHELKRIELSGCNNLMSIPNLPQNIVTVQAFNCESLVNLPSNMSELQSLTELYLDGCLKLEPEGFMKVTGLRNLHRLSMRNCNVSQVSGEIGNLVSLEYLNLSENSFSNLPDSFSNLSKLVKLEMKDCNQLQSIPFLPSNLTRIEASRCWSLDVMRYDSIQMAYFLRSKMLEESFFTKPLEIILSGDEVPEWCNFRSNGSVLSFVAPMQHLDNKIRGVILCATFIKEWNPSGKPKILPIMLNKTKKTCHHFRDPSFNDRGSMCVMFSPLIDTTLVVEAGDIVLLKFHDYSTFTLWGMSCGLRLIYEGDVVDSELCIQTPFTFTDPLEMTVDASITQLYDVPIFSFPFLDNDQYISYNFFPENLSNNFFETTLVLPSVMMTTAGARITELDDDDDDYEYLYNWNNCFYSDILF